MLTHLPPTSKVNLNPGPCVGKLVVAYRWWAAYSTQLWLTVYTGFLCPQNCLLWYDLYSVEDDVKPQVNREYNKFIYLIFLSHLVPLYWVYYDGQLAGERKWINSWLGCGTVNCRPTVSNCQHSHFKLDTPGYFFSRGSQLCYHCANEVPYMYIKVWYLYICSFVYL